MTVVILLGPPGAGKGTQASRIAERLGIPAISTGDIFRANMAEGTEIGKQAKAYMDRGEFVPDSVTNTMVRARLAAPDTADGFLLDGYPRSVEQAHTLRDMLLDLGKQIDVVVEIQVDEDEVEAAESFELPGADLSHEELTVRVLPRQSNEFTCASCFLVKSQSQLAETKGELKYCVDCV